MARKKGFSYVIAAAIFLVNLAFVIPALIQIINSAKLTALTRVLWIL